MSKKEPGLQSLSSKIESLISLKTKYKIPHTRLFLGAGIVCLFLATIALSSFVMPKAHLISVALTKSQRATAQIAANNQQVAENLSEITPAAGEPFEAAAEPQLSATAQQPSANNPQPSDMAENNVASAPVVKVPAASEASAISQKNIALGKGGTLIGVLVKKAGVDGHAAYQALTALKKVYDPRDMRAKDKVAVLFENKAGAAVFMGMKVTERDGSTVTVARAGDGSFTSRVQKVQLHPVVRQFSGRIGNSFYVSARNKGVPARVILSMIKLYAQSVDFKRGVRASDRYKVLYREYARDNGTIDASKGADIIYADLTLGHQDMPLYRYRDAHNVVGYYDAHGHAAQKSIWRHPIRGAWISSPFGPRVDPITGHRGFHPGVDYAADTGTPIMAAGDGVIVERHWWGGYGRYIRIRHTRHLATAYGHMSRFRKGLHVGSRVKQGEVIGYVGMTGHATGPHLHFEILVNGRQRDPLTVPLPHFGKSLHGRTLVAFRRHIRAINGTYRVAERANAPVRIALNTQR